MASSNPGRKSTIYDVAKATGSSTATVSMVLNGSWVRYPIKEEILVPTGLDKTFEEADQTKEFDR
ncbi:LacI family DNA-binding transcriptional regulator [Paraburkholderia xenovorans]|uniref:LacI family DNA-binding transcriptional regulator n=1 Tax=Paraburkholderia xenovorans TaxID=36873 RepID=UPI0038B8524A